jgi:UDP-glucose 4-epimerase
MQEFGWEPRHSELEEIIMGAWEWEQTQCEQTLLKQAGR